MNSLHQTIMYWRYLDVVKRCTLTRVTHFGTRSPGSMASTFECICCKGKWYYSGEEYRCHYWAELGETSSLVIVFCVIQLMAMMGLLRVKIAVIPIMYLSTMSNIAYFWNKLPDKSLLFNRVVRGQTTRSLRLRFPDYTGKQSYGISTHYPLKAYG